jgi:hypothetical protein
MSISPISRELDRALEASEIGFKTADLGLLHITEEDLNQGLACEGNYRGTNDSCNPASFVAASTLDY